MLSSPTADLAQLRVTAENEYSQIKGLAVVTQWYKEQALQVEDWSWILRQLMDRDVQVSTGLGRDLDSAAQQF